MDSSKILVVEDDKNARDFLDEMLSLRFRVILAEDGEEGLQLARCHIPDLILLDVILPKLSGMTVCEVLRQDSQTAHIPVLMITGLGDTESRIRAYNCGADDFIEKPFGIKELFARIQSKLRRVEESVTHDETLKCGNLTINVSKLEAKIAESVLSLSVLEFNLLKYLVQNCNHVVSRERIMEAVWKDSSVGDRTVDTRIAYLRKKLSGFDCELKTIYGAGYILKSKQ